MTLLWIGDAVLLLVVLPIVIHLLRGVLSAVSDIVPAIERIGTAAAALSKDLDAAPALLTTQDQVAQTLAGRDVDFVGLVARLVFLRIQVFEARDEGGEAAKAVDHTRTLAA